MKNFLLILLIFCPIELLSQPFWTKINSPSGGPVSRLASGGGGLVFGAGGAGGGSGIYRSTNAGEQWSGLDNLPPPYITEVVIDGFDGTVLAIDGGNGYIWISTNQGDDWHPWETGYLPTSYYSVIVPDGHGQIFITSPGAVYRSTSHGAPFLKSTTGLMNTEIPALGVNGRGELFAGAQSTYGPYYPPIDSSQIGGVFKSTDNGDTWTKKLAINIGEVTSIAILADTVIFVATTAGVYRSTDDGESWNSQMTGHDFTAAIVLPNSKVLAGTEEGQVYQSSDNGASWNLFGAGIGNGPSQFVLSGSLVLAATGKGVFKSTDDGLSWFSANTGFEGTGLMNILFAPDSSVYANTRTGLFRSTDMFATWSAVSNGADPLANLKGFVIAGNGDLVVARKYYGPLQVGIIRSTDRGTSWAASNAGMASSEIIALGENKNGDIYAFTSSEEGIYRSTDDGIDWVNVYQGGVGLNITSIAFNDSGDIFLGQYNGIYRSTNDGTTWSLISTLTGAQLLVNHHGDIFARADGFYRSTDDGDTWTLIQGVPGMNSLVVNSTGEFFASGGSRILYSVDDGLTWNEISTPTPAQYGPSLTVDGNDNLYALVSSRMFKSAYSTNGYGLNLHTSGGGYPHVTRIPDRVSYPAGTSVQLTAADYDQYQFVSWSGDASGSANPLTITMDSYKDITATFELKPGYAVSYRTVAPENIPFEVDNRGRPGKAVKRKMDKFFYEFYIVVDPPPAANGIALAFSTQIMPRNNEFRITTRRPYDFGWYENGNKKQVNFVFLNPTLSPGDTIFVQTLELNGKPVSLANYYWFTMESGTTATPRIGPVRTDFVVTRNSPGYPMPNRVNILEETFARGGFNQTHGLLVGQDRRPGIDSSRYYGWLLATSPANVMKSLHDRSTLHSGSPRGFDTFNSGSRLVKRQTSISPSKQNNQLLAQMIALKLNIAASTVNVTPPGLGELIYDAINYDSTKMFDGMMVRDIAHFGDSLMMGYYDATHHHVFADQASFNRLERALELINNSFEGSLDTLSFLNVLQTKGTWPLVDVGYLHANPSILPTVISGLVQDNIDAPSEFHLYQNYPNPFNPMTTIAFDLPAEGVVNLKIFNILGQEVKILFDDQMMDAGDQEVQFDAAGMPSGVYFYRLSVVTMDDDGGQLRSYNSVKKMLVVK